MSDSYLLNIHYKGYKKELKFKFPIISDNIDEVKNILEDLLKRYDITLYYVININNDKMLICTPEYRELQKFEFIF